MLVRQLKYHDCGAGRERLDALASVAANAVMKTVCHGAFVNKWEREMRWLRSGDTRFTDPGYFPLIYLRDRLYIAQQNIV